MNRVCTICARGGSKGVPNKNIRELNGKPLIAYTLQQAKASELFAVVAVSSDSEAILKVAKDYGADLLVKRPDELASDNAPKIPAIKHCVLEAEKKLGRQFDVICDLDPTAPFRKIEDLKNCIKILELQQVSNVITGAKSRKSPYFNMVELDKHGMAQLSKSSATKVFRRQDAPQCYDMNASIYVWRRGSLMDSETVFLTATAFYEMPRERSIEIDTEFDFNVAEFFAAKGYL